MNLTDTNRYYLVYHGNGMSHSDGLLRSNFCNIFITLNNFKDILYLLFVRNENQVLNLVQALLKSTTAITRRV